MVALKWSSCVHLTEQSLSTRLQIRFPFSIILAKLANRRSNHQSGCILMPDTAALLGVTPPSFFQQRCSWLRSLARVSLHQPGYSNQGAMADEHLAAQNSNFWERQDVPLLSLVTTVRMLVSMFYVDLLSTASPRAALAYWLGHFPDSHQCLINSYCYSQTTLFAHFVFLK